MLSKKASGMNFLREAVKQKTWTETISTARRDSGKVLHRRTALKSN